jgi:hypothetical protein
VTLSATGPLSRDGAVKMSVIPAATATPPTMNATVDALPVVTAVCESLTPDGLVHMVPGGGQRAV